MPQPESSRAINVIIVGAGKAGQLILHDIKHSDSSFNVVGLVDDDPAKQSTEVEDVPVLGTVADLSNLIRAHEAEEVFIAIPSERGAVIRHIIENTAGLKVAYKILPRQSEVLLQDFNKDYLKYLRPVRPEDLLGGEILKSDQQAIADFVKGQVVLVTGAAGSIGSELSRQLAAYGPKKLIMYDWWEQGMYNLRLEQLRETSRNDRLEFIIGDIKDRKKLDLVMKTYRPTAVFHAAAYKHVPLMEDNPAEAIKNNIDGTKTVAEIAVKYKVKKFVLVSTDKAVNPTNIMGATKRAAEKVIHILAASQPDTTFCAVRFGNVINSNGSVIPKFKKEIERGGPVGVTHRDITRFFMTIPEAVHLILQAWVMGQSNDLFVLDMGEAVKIYELAGLLIVLHGYVPEEDIKIEITGLRPGEKLYEEVLVDEEQTKATAVKKIFRTKNYMDFDKLVFLNQLNLLLESLEEDGLNITNLKTSLREMIPTYKPKQ